LFIGQDDPEDFQVFRFSYQLFARKTSGIIYSVLINSFSVKV